MILFNTGDFNLDNDSQQEGHRVAFSARPFLG